MIIIEVIIIRPQTGTMVVSFDLKTESNFSPGLRRGQLQGAVRVHRAGPGDQGQPLVGKQELFSRSRVYSESEFQICLQNLSSFGSSSAYLCFAPRCDENVVFILRNCKKNFILCLLYKSTVHVLSSKYKIPTSLLSTILSSNNAPL